MCTFIISNAPVWDHDFEQQLALGGPTGTKTVSIDGIFITHHLRAVTGQPTKQPIESNGKYFLLLGEIYNFDRKHASDIYFAIEKYHEFGDRVTDHLDGEFLFIVVDADTMSIDFYSDPWGTRQLWFYRDGDTFCFSTLPMQEPVSQPECRFLFYRKYNDKAYQEYFNSHEKEWVKRNQRLLGNSHYRFNVRQRTLTLIDDCLHRWNLTQFNQSFEQIEQAFENAVLKKHTDTSTLFLSGGIDSACIAACLTDYGIKFNSMTLQLKEFEDEQSLASILLYSQNHNTHYILRDESLPDANDEKIRQLLIRRGSVDTISSSQLFIREQVRKKFNSSVVLSGNGADEILDNYRTKKLSEFDLWPDDLSATFPWTHFYHGMGRRLLDFHETVSLAYGLEQRNIFYDKDLAQEWINVVPSLKNIETKSFLKQYLRRRGIYVTDRIAGFQDSKLYQLKIQRK